MTRKFIAAAAQLGPIARDESRASAVARMVALMREAHRHGVSFIVFPELALTTFFPRWYLDDPQEVDAFFETEMPNAATEPLFDTARLLNMSFYIGYAERAEEAGEIRHFNTSILVDGTGSIIGKYRKIHLPGHFENEDWRPFQHLEKRYFDVGDSGFEVFDALDGKVGMCLCNDRRWPETYRVLGLRGAELVALGYNTPRHYPPAPEHDHLQDFHNHLCMQAGAYANGCWVIAAAKAGVEEGCDLIGGSCIITPTGEIAAQAKGTGDELVIAEVDLNRCKEIRDNIFNFSLHRQPQFYGPICSPAGSKT